MPPLSIDPPPRFRGLDPALPVVCHRRHLPHWRQDGATYFATYRLADSLAERSILSLKQERDEWLERHPPPDDAAERIEFAKLFSTKVERWLDAGSGSCILADIGNARLVETALRHFERERYELFAYVVMPNHFHVVVKPLANHDLDTIWESWKRFTARQLARRGVRLRPVWSREGYDRIVRDVEHLYRVVRYLGRNPQKAGLSIDRCPHGLDPEWAACGWRLFDET